MFMLSNLSRWSREPGAANRKVERLLAAAAAVLAMWPLLAVAAVLVPPPAGAQKLLDLRGDGVQIYACADSGGKTAWAFKGPEANLYDPQGLQVGTHFAGPSWKLADGSTIAAEVVGKADAPRPGAIPWLLLRVTNHNGSGGLDAVAFVRRADTSGGLAPKTGCDAAHLGAAARVHYSAAYQFFAAAK